MARQSNSSPSKATIKNLDTGRVINVKFNPSEYTIQKANNWTAKDNKGKNIPQLEFSGGGARTMNLELLLDSYEEAGKDIRQDVEQLWQLTMISTSTKNSTTNRGRPPRVLFQWGGQWSFKAVVLNLSVRYILFRQDGMPVRAIATITLQEAEDETQQKGTNPTSYSEPGYKRREIRYKDTLPLIAFEEYGDANLWRAIAQANSIDDPMSLAQGEVISIPPAHRIGK